MSKQNFHGKSDSREKSDKSFKSDRYKGGKGKSSKGNKRGFHDSKESEAKEGTNDPSWYQIDEQLFKDAGQFSFNNPLGAIVPKVVENTNFRFPGVAAILYAPTIGEASDATSPVNLQAKKLISFLRSKVSNKLDFAAADAMMYLLAMDGMYSFYAFCVRLYGLHNAYMGMNRYYPNALFEAMGVTANSTDDWNSFRTWINTWAYQLSQVFVPSSITYFQRHMWMNSNVYLDAADSKSQTYVFSPEYIYKWDGTTSTNGTKLAMTKFPRGEIIANGQVVGTTNLTSLMNQGNELLTSLLEDKDIGELSGLILRAFGEGNCIKLSTISEDFAIAPVFNPEVMTQIHNATICGSLKTTNGAADITQTEYDTLSVNYHVTDTNGVSHLRYNRLLDLDTPSPSINDTFVATRLQVTGKLANEQGTEAELTAFGSEIVTQIILYSVGSHATISTACLPQTPTGLTLVETASQFRSFPYMYRTVTQGTTITPKGIIGDVSNYTTLSDDDLTKIHSAATMSLFAIPTVGSK